MKKKIVKNKYILVAFLVALIPRLLLLIRTYPLSIVGDEMFAMWPAAKWLGYDWSGVMKNYRYYGYGYTALLIPFMMLIKNPVILYRSIVAFMALCQAMVAPISFHLMKKYFDMSDERFVCLISVTCSYLVAVRATYTYPEFVYVLMVWVIIWILLKLTTNSVQENKKMKAFYTFLLFGALSYAYMVHSRAVALWGALIVTATLHVWIYRKVFLSVLVSILTGIPAFLVVKAGIEKVITFLGIGQNELVSNTSVGASFQLLEWFKNPKSWTAWADIIIGQLNESVVLTGGLAVVIVVVICMLIWRALCRDEIIISDEKTEYLPYIVSGIFCICAIGITIGGQSLTWLGGVVTLIEQNESGDSFRAITYLRYYAAYIGPLFMLGVAYILQHAEIMKNIKGKILLITSLLQGYWVLVILPILCYELGCVWSYAPFSLTKGFAEESVGIRSYLPGTAFVFVFLVLSYQLFKRKKEKVIIVLLCSVLIYTYLFNGMYHERYRGEKNYQYCKDVVEWLKEAEACGAEMDEIYVVDGMISEDGITDALEYQFLMPEKKIISGFPDKDKAICLVHNPNIMQEKRKTGYEKIKITGDTYICVWGDIF